MRQTNKKIKKTTSQLKKLEKMKNTLSVQLWWEKKENKYDIKRKQQNWIDQIEKNI